MKDQLELFAQPDAHEGDGRTTPMPKAAFEFFLGAHHADWLTRTNAPLFISRRTLEGRRSLPRALGRWALDSGGFTELSLHGRWLLAPRDYAKLVARLADDVGGLAWAAVQDWMCEELILKRTGLTVPDHQRLTTASFLELKSIAPHLPWTPVLQGWTRGDYLDHLEAYARVGIDLTKLPVVGVGSVCRRQHTLRAAILMNELAELGLRVHAFGFKTNGLKASFQSLTSSDSLAWSLHARKTAPHPDCDHKRCSNCLRFALAWRDDLLAKLCREQGTDVGF